MGIKAFPKEILGVDLGGTEEGVVFEDIKKGDDFISSPKVQIIFSLRKKTLEYFLRV